MIKLTIDNINTTVKNLPDDAIDEIKNLISYTTREYFGMKATVIKRTLYDDYNKSFPTGLLNIIIQYLKDNNLQYTVTDSRVAYMENEIDFHATFRDYQKTVVDASIKKQRGIIQVATGGGKTIIAAGIIAKLNVPTIFCVHTKDLLQQAYDVFTDVLKIPIGIVGAGLVKIEKINICMMQTLGHALDFKYIPADEFDTYAEESPSMKNRMSILKMIQDVHCVIVDECHHISALTYVDLMSSLPMATFRFGMSGTPFRDDGRDLILNAYAGQLLCKVSASYLIEKNYLLQPTIYMVNTPYMLESPIANYNSIYKDHVVNNKPRNELIAKYVKKYFKQKRKTLILVTQVNHGKILYNLIKKIDPKVQLLIGEVDFKVRVELIRKMREGKLHTLIGTNLADEGLDIPILDTLILAGGGKSSVRALQRIGRIIRLHPKKQNPIVIDLVDNPRFLYNHAKKRINIYKLEKNYILHLNDEYPPVEPPVSVF
jgi:superfamily II DNA or RNA helicase